MLVDGSSVGAVSSYTFEDVTSNHTITASFAINTYTLSYTAGTGGTLTGDVLQVVSYGGSGTAVTAVANPGYHFVNWSDGYLNATRTDTNVTADISVTANFEENATVTYTITASAGENGSIAPSGAVTVNEGASQTFNITPAEGYHIADIMVDGTSVGIVSTYTFNNVIADHTIAASFAIDTYTISATASVGGSITPSGAVVVNWGVNQTFTITPVAGYHIADVVVDGLSVGAVSTYTFYTVTANHVIAASFAIDTYTITASAGDNGSITPSGVVTVNSGESESFAISPATGYHIADVLVDGVSVGAVSTYIFNDVTANHTITASFAINTYTITASADENGSITPSGAVVVNSGASQTFAITPVAGYHVADVLVDGSSMGGITSYTFNDVTTNHTIAASFAINTYTLTYTAGTGGTLSGAAVQNVDHGGNGTAVTAVANPGYHFVDWSDGVTTATRTDTNIMADISVTAHFAETSTSRSIPLVVGWNLVSFDLHLANSEISTVLSDISGHYDLVYAYDSTGAHATSGNWMKYDPTGPGYQNTLSSLDETMGFWIHMTAADTLEVTGTVPSNTEISLSDNAGGWNLVSYPSLANGALPAALSDHGVGTDFSLVFAYHPQDVDQWKVFDRTAPEWSNDLTEMTAGWGYWIRVSADHTWVVVH